MRSIFLVATLAVLGGCKGIDGPKECTSNDECFENYACDVDATKTCLRVCTNDSECVATTQICDIPVGASEGLCRGGNRGGGDSAGGD